MMKKAFTLIEVMIVITVLGMLFVILSKVYITASKLYVYQKHNKNVEKDILFFNQNLQNLVDNTEIDYSKYSKLDINKGFTGNLFLKDGDIKYKLYLSGEIVYLDKNGYTVPITTSGATSVRYLKFKIIPFKDPYEIVGYGQTAMHPFVKVFMHIQNKYYNSVSWENAVDYKLEEGFNFKYFKN